MTKAAFSPTNYIDEIKLAVEGHHELPLIVQNAHILFIASNHKAHCGHGNYR